MADTNTLTNTLTRTESGSQLVAALEHVWSTIQERHPEVPDVVMITGSGRQMFGLVWGHYGHDFWANGRWVVDSNGEIVKDHKPELFVSGETLGVGAAKTVNTLLHEASHALAKVRDVQDTSRQHRYHNKRFLAIAEELGLEYTHDGPDATIGFSAVTITDETREAYADVIAELDAAIALSMELPGWLTGLTGGGQGGGDTGHGRRKPRQPGKPKTGYRKATCGCDRVIRVAASTLEDAPITCGKCGEDFELAA